MGCTILVTGGSGFIGSHLMRALVERGDDVVNCDIMPPWRPTTKWLLEPVADKIAFEECNVSADYPGLQRAIKDHKVDKILHAAAVWRPDYEMKHPYFGITVSVLGTLNVLEAARLLGVGRIVYAGSISEYPWSIFWSPGVDMPNFNISGSYLLDEFTPMFDPASGPTPYNCTKQTASLIGMCYHTYLGIDWINIRISTPYGFGDKREKTTELMVENAVDGVPTKIPSQGNGMKDMTYIKDEVKAILLALDAENEKLTQRAFQISSQEMTNDLQAYEIIGEHIPGVVCEFGDAEEKSRRPFNPSVFRRLREELGYVPEYNLKDAIQDYIDIYRRYLEDISKK